MKTQYGSATEVEDKEKKLDTLLFSFCSVEIRL